MRFENRGLLILLGVLCVVIVGLGIVLVRNGIENAEDSQIDCANMETSDEVSICIGDFYNLYGDKTASIDEYNKSIELSNGMENYEKTSNLIVDRSVFLVSEVQDCEEALKLIGDENIENMSADYRAVIYTGAVGISVDCSDKEEELRWNNLLTEAMSEIIGGEAFL